jgi:hypothetical protein
MNVTYGPAVRNGFEDGVGLGEDGVFQDGLVGDEGVHGADAADGGVEGVEEFVGDAGGDLRAVAPTEHVLVSDDHAAGLADRGGDGLPVVGIEGAQVEDFYVDVVLALGALGGLQGARDECAVGDEREVEPGRTMRALPKGMAKSGPG